MAMTIEQAKTLQSGDLLSFGTGHTYEVISAVPSGRGVAIALRRDDGVETHANENDLDVATRIEAVPVEPPAPEPPVNLDVVEAVSDKPTKSKSAKGG